MKKACLFLYGASAALMIYSTVFQLQHQLYAKLGYLAMALGVQLIGPLVVKGLKLKRRLGSVVLDAAVYRHRDDYREYPERLRDSLF